MPVWIEIYELYQYVNHTAWHPTGLALLAVDGSGLADVVWGLRKFGKYSAVGLVNALTGLDEVDRADVGLPDRAPAAGEQLDMLGDDAAAGEIAEVGAVDQARQGPGRPPGAKDKADADLVRWLQAKGYREPIIGLMELGGGGSFEELVLRMRVLVREVGLKPDKAAEIVYKAAAEAQRYWRAAKTPEKGDNDGRPGVVIVYAEGDVRMGSAADVPFVEVEQNQQVIDATPAECDTRQSDA